MDAIVERTRQTVIGAILDFLAGQDLLTLNDIRIALERELAAAGPDALLQLKAHLVSETGWEYSPADPLVRRIHHLLADRFLRADRLIDTNSMELAVYGNDAEEQILAVASLDNLGKGASGAAVQVINLKTGVPETTGLAVAA